MDEPGELQLWARARRDDGDAFGRLFDLHRVRVYRRALGLVADRHDAEDVTATAFFELWRKRRSVMPVNGSVLPWLLVTVVNVSRNLRRSASRYEKFLRAAPRQLTADEPNTETVETRERLAVALKELAPIDGALLVLVVLEDLPVAEAAEAVGLKPAAARVRLHRARARLRESLPDLDPRPRPVEGVR